MKFGVTVLLIAALGYASAEALPDVANSLPDLEPAGQAASRAVLSELESAACPPAYPRACPGTNFCCYTSKCCSRECCQEWATVCYNGYCYG